MTLISYAAFDDLVRGFAEARQIGYKKETVKNLLMKAASDGYAESSFLYILQRVCGLDHGMVTCAAYEEAVRQTVKSYTSSKETAIDLFKRLTDYINSHAGSCYTLNYPPIQSGNTFERLMFISKYIQDPDNRISDLEDLLWVSSRTIESDIAKLRGFDDDPIQICGKKYVVPDITRSGDSVRDMASTPHPLFLTCNLTQVITLLKGLKSMSQNKALHGYAMKTASEIWEQLSDSAKARILLVLRELMPDEVEWYQNLSATDDNTFWPEDRCSTYGGNVVLECLKNGLPCWIEYKTDSGTEFLSGVMVTKFLGGSVTVSYEGNSRTLELNRIIRSAKTAEEMV